MKQEVKKNKGGRPWFDGKEEKEVLRKLEEAFAIGCTNREACLYSDISEAMYYNYVKQRPELSKKFEAMRDKPILKARYTVVKGLDEVETAKWYLKNKRNKEFTERDTTDHEGSIKIIPILDVRKNNSNGKNNGDVQEIEGNTRRNECIENNLNPSILDSISSN